MANGNLYAEAELLRAIELREGGSRPWREVGSRLGRSPGSLSHAVWRYRNGKILGTAEKHARNRVRIVRLFETTDLTITEIARALDLHEQSVDKILRDAGLDAEMRREMGKGRAIGRSV